jgi:hypothetical protein
LKPTWGFSTDGAGAAGADVGVDGGGGAGNGGTGAILGVSSTGGGDGDGGAGEVDSTGTFEATAVAARKIVVLFPSRATRYGMPAASSTTTRVTSGFTLCNAVRTFTIRSSVLAVTPGTPGLTFLKST